MHRYLILLLLACLAGCAPDDHTTDGLTHAMTRAAASCETSRENMQWLETLLVQAGSEGSAYGNVYIIPTSQGTVFVHQPVMMSCLACRTFACDGTEITLDNPLVYDEVVPGISPSHLLYKAPL
ncbi:hypothetical protein [Parachryseolinea silvisoli]|uniref:hypothetical protein n=1 Tax=Parachryseolinea silvisoli TaxID=2873601 RepID=UPI0022658D52|nr:hypothetical protein [Parachryseolinea silvisoli]MCD9014987.1 hypothetical protein [Parachryseolinea silvisoli]